MTFQPSILIVIIALAAILAIGPILMAADSFVAPVSGRCATIELQERYGKYIRDPGTSMRDLPCDYTPVGPPADVQIGSQWQWYIWSLNGPPEANLMNCTVRGSSEHAWIVVEDSQWGVNVTQADIDAVLNYFENESVGQFPTQGIWDLNTGHFGAPPDHLDQDGKVYIVYYDFDVSSDGFFWSFDQACDGTAAYASNECDALYMNCSDNAPSGDYMVGVLAHEFEHLIHYEQDDNEVSWVDEGCAELAMWLFGHPDTISMFNNNPDNNLTIWSGNWADYIKTYLWMLYFYEQFGGQAAVFDLVIEPANSIAGFTNFFTNHGFSAPFSHYFTQWTIANYLDEPGIDVGQFGYAGDDLPPFATTAQHSTYPATQSATVNHWAADYIRFTGSSPLRIEFQGDDTTDFTVYVLQIAAGYWPVIRSMVLDSARDGEIVLDDFGSIYAEAILVVAGTANTGGTTYSYAATEYTPPTATPVQTATPAPTATPIWYGDDPAMRLLLNGDDFGGGDRFLLEVEFWNPDVDPLHVDTFIVLSVIGNYWFWPTWVHISEGIDFDDMILPSRVVSGEEILEFIWPAGTGSALDLCFLGVILDHDTGIWYGETISQVCFDYHD